MLSGKRGGRATPTQFGTPQYWRERAAESRVMAEQTNDLEAKDAMFTVARSLVSVPPGKARPLQAEIETVPHQRGTCPALCYRPQWQSTVCGLSALRAAS
jgi:hypothetical protein